MKQTTTLFAILLFLVSFSFAQETSDSISQHKQCFFDSKTQIENMLMGKDSLDYQKAVFLSENPYWDNMISYKVFSRLIDFHAENISYIAETNRDEASQNFSATFLETEQQKREKYNNLLYNWAIYTYISDTTLFTYQLDSLNVLYAHLPYTYSTQDPQALLNWSHSQVLHLLQNKSANCNALTSFYKIFAERFQTNADISIAPGHIYITHTNQKDIHYNVELANNAFPKTGTIMTLTYTPLQAVQNGIALRALNVQEATALCLVNLAKAYEHTFNTKSSDFQYECATTVLQYDSLNLNAMLLQAEVLEQRVIATQKTIAELQSNREFQEYQNLITKLYKKGYREMPLEMKNQIINRLFKDSTFISITDHTPKGFQTISPPNERYATVSSGMFEEVHEPKDFEQYGRAIFNTQTNTITQFVTADSLYNNYPIDPVVSAWQIDPLAHEFPSMSPYSAFANNPIIFIDPDGRKVVFAEGVSVEFKKYFAEAVKYLNEKDASAMLAKLEDSDIVYYIKEGDGMSSFNPNTNTVEWDPTLGLITNEGHILSPTSVLNHEIDHALEEDLHPEEKRKRKKIKDPHYTNLEEKRVITGSEQETAKKLGEIKDDEVTRKDHGGYFYSTKGPTTTDSFNTVVKVGVPTSKKTETIDKE